MKLPNILTIQQACILSVAALVLALFLKLFGGLAVTLLAAIAFLAVAYAAAKKFLPELFTDDAPGA